ncbi:MAG: hypothetical protein O3C40_04160 [Planctomycetota bacterium]|nr:hypothetical protein [Planctomycetota bacterium]
MAIADADKLKRDEARRAVNDLFEIMGIRRVIVVDDSYSASPAVDNVLALCLTVAKSEHAASLKKIDCFKGADLIVDDDDVLRKRLKDCLKDATEVELKSISVSLTDFRDGRDDGENATRLVLEDILGEHDYQSLSLQQWQSNKDDLLSEDSAKETLFLFDQDMSLGDGRENEGIQIIASLLKSEDHTSIRCGLLSHTVPANDEHETWVTLSTQHDLDLHKDRFAVLAKAHLNKAPLAFAFRLKRLAISGRCAEMRDTVCNVVEQANEAARTKLGELNIYDFEQIVFQSSYMEGVWEPDTLIRLFNLFHSDEARRIAMSDEQLRKNADDVRKVVTLRFRPDDAPRSSSCAIRHLELYEDGSFLSSHHIPIELGDIFELRRSGKKGEYVLVAQSCDLMVRSDGTRNGKELVLAELVKNKPQTDSVAFMELTFYEANTPDSVWVRFSKPKLILAEILDLCVLSENGVAVFAPTAEAPGGLLPSWNERLSLLRQHYQQRLDSYRKAIDEATDQLSSETIALIQLQLTGLSGDIARSSIDLNKQQFEYGVTRVGRVKEPVASSMLRAYARHISRDAFEHDFTRELAS